MISFYLICRSDDRGGREGGGRRGRGSVTDLEMDCPGSVWRLVGGRGGGGRDGQINKRKMKRFNNDI